MPERPAPAPHVLLVDDDARLRELLTRYLSGAGYRVTARADTRDLDRVRERDPPNLIVLDWMLPHEDGLAACKRLRAAGDMTPLLMLTAKGELDERVAGLEGGADDYLAKPFEPRELIARLQALLRRAALAAPAAPLPGAGTIAFGDCQLNLETRTLVRAGQPVALTSAEFAMLKVLVTHPNEPMSRDRLSMLARGKPHDPFDRSVDVQIARLRKLVEPNPAQPRYIQTLWARGYVFVPDPRPPQESTP
ncbi:MAG: response regulator [Casimicrobiaceae bacterium]|nr:response regulator [Casimicrobiaceae bacterium]MDW8311785.1 response regulator [Burkholderiales bacterium]